MRDTVASTESRSRSNSHSSSFALVDHYARAAQRRLSNFSVLNVLRTFPQFIPYSEGSYKARSKLTVQAINETIPLLSELAASVGKPKTPVTEIVDFPDNDEQRQAANALKQHFDAQGSDKSNHHSYHHLYGAILANREAMRSVIEIGIGTQHSDTVSYMVAGKPGGSLRAFRDFLPFARIYGADIDRRVLFKEERIETFFVDQTEPATFEQLARSVDGECDLIIDDGLHSPNANIQTLIFGLKKVRRGGWVVVEDIGHHALPVWQAVSALLPEHYRRHIVNEEHGLVFAVQRLE
ncbi:hypothetical protein [Paraburkholderia tuberum]|uniref:Methyltransferase domain-containing protein n=1 Tax=Paraburkholderia tuberum TaxID=157910 RepID=A0A1H1JVE7_9BURK|nr:hypothetical protein [Paraburkholderia tuberum]SDR53719.1 hypothetical protein SAMN05445850_5753 [Paraburkholderia tuberum]